MNNHGCRHVETIWAYLYSYYIYVYQDRVTETKFRAVQHFSNIDTEHLSLPLTTKMFLLLKISGMGWEEAAAR